MRRRIGLLCVLLSLPLALYGQVGDGAATTFQFADVFQLEYAADPQISPDGQRVVYVRNFMDIMSDRQRGNLWIINIDGSEHRALTTGNHNDHSPRWSPDGRRLIYVSSDDGSAQLYLRWMDTGQTAKLTNLTRAPGGLAWSPDGQWIALSQFVPAPAKSVVSLPQKPKGATWADPAVYIDQMIYRRDGAGYVERGYTHLFVLPAEGGTPRQVTGGDFDHSGTPAWAPDGKTLIFSANRHPDAEHDPRNSEIYELDLASGGVRPLTNRQGPDHTPAISPDGKSIAYLGFDDRLQGYQVTKLYVMNRDGSGNRVLAADLDRDIARPQWSGDGSGVYFQYDDQGNTKIGYVAAAGGGVQTLAADVGGLSLGRPYAGGMFTVAANGNFAFTMSRPDFPADVATGSRQSRKASRITRLNDDLFGHKELGQVEAFWCKSSYDGRDIQGWIVKPPQFDSNKKYPMILEIHGGPFANYGDRFTAEIQLYAAAGYVVVYTNPRGSTSYGETFGNLIHHNYPGQDFDDLMSCVDAVIAKGYIDTDNLFVTGGSGGGVLTSWIVGHTDRFRAAVVQKPVINWYSFVLTADMYNFFHKYWFPGYPWEHAEHYLQRSPIHHVGKVTTPTMLLTGENDHRTPISETEQFYQALKLRKVETAMVRVPGAAHGIAARPSHLISKVAHILHWFDKHRHENGSKTD